LGSFLDTETLSLLKDLSFYDSRLKIKGYNGNLLRNNDFQSYYYLNPGLFNNDDLLHNAGKKRNFFLFGVNLRQTFPLINIKLKQLVEKKLALVYIYGFSFNLSYQNFCEGNSLLNFYSMIKGKSILNLYLDNAVLIGHEKFSPISIQLDKLTKFKSFDFQKFFFSFDKNKSYEDIHLSVQARDLEDKTFKMNSKTLKKSLLFL